MEAVVEQAGTNLPAVLPDLVSKDAQSHGANLRMLARKHESPV